MNNFETLHRTWEEAVELVQNLDTKVRVRGLTTLMNMFESECDNIHGKKFYACLQSVAPPAHEGLSC